MQRSYNPFATQWLGARDAGGNAKIVAPGNLSSAATMQNYRAKSGLGGTPTAEQIAAQEDTRAAAANIMKQETFRQQTENYLRKARGIPAPGNVAATGGLPIPKPAIVPSGGNVVNGAVQPATEVLPAPATTGGGLGEKFPGHISPESWASGRDTSTPVAPDAEMQARIAAASGIGPNAKPYSSPMVTRGGMGTTPTQSPVMPPADELPLEVRSARAVANAQYPPVDTDNMKLNKATQQFEPTQNEDGTPKAAKGGRFDTSKKMMSMPMHAAKGGRMGPKPIPKAGAMMPPPNPTAISAPQGVDPNSTGQQAKANVKQQGQDIAAAAPGAPPVLAGEAGPEIKANDDGTMESINEPTMLQGGKPGAIIPNKSLQALKKKFDKRPIQQKKAAMGGRVQGGVNYDAVTQSAGTAGGIAHPTTTSAAGAVALAGGGMARPPIVTPRGGSNVPTNNFGVQTYL